ncbi:MAG: hypothetical protein EBW68_09085 [Actinobacteria bacterium]|jgi:hypothetical protein|nr:hypothetical protein [Actinomycetota bacterium]
MSRIIKNFDSFSDEETNESFQFSDLGGFFDGLLGFAGEGLRKTIKQKVAAKLMEQIGVEENSNMSVIVQEVVDQIPIEDYPELLTGEKANVDYLAPLMAKALQEFIQRKGLDSLATQMGIKPTGWLYSTLREGLQSEKGKAIIENALIEAFGGPGAKGSVGRDALASLSDTDKNQLSSIARDKASQFYGNTSSASQSDRDKGAMDYLSTFWNSLTGKKEA